MSFGITPTGFVAKPLEIVRQELADELLEALGLPPGTPLRPTLDLLVGIFADRLESVWDVLEDLYQSGDPDQASGDALEILCALTGITRREAAPSRAVVTVYGDENTVLPAGRVVSVAGTGQRFTTLTEVTIDESTSGEEDPPAAYKATVAVEAEETGPVAAPAGSLSVIETPVAGWVAVTNPEDAVLGRHRETDADLRERREGSLRRQGSGSLAAIRARLMDLDGVIAVRMFENSGATTNPDGMPPHAIEALVQGGATDEILQTVWQHKPGGILAHGNVSGTVTDDDGVEHTVAFTRPVEVPVLVTLTVTVADDFPSNGADQIKEAIVSHASETVGIGDDVYASRMYKPVFRVSGVVDVEELLIGTFLPVSNTKVSITSRQLATFDASDITVVVQS